ALIHGHAPASTTFCQFFLWYRSSATLTRIELRLFCHRLCPARAFQTWLQERIDAQTFYSPKFVMWRSIPKHEQLGWERHWLGNELDPSAVFNVRGLGLREPMFNADVFRPIGTGDWLIKFFHEPAQSTFAVSRRESRLSSRRVSQADEKLIVVLSEFE
ncbi:hypothetical protein, partial [Stieleria mannarensis]|uniref:hypothetical protein n=1 Tax=Stieleria mannarensis TaxID=2755585 RepID=UPI001C722B19